jgi:short-subunit dehydrogenase/acyl carrier protein
VVVPAGQTGTGLAGGCADALAARGARVVVAEVGVEEIADRKLLAARVDAGAVAGVVSLLGLAEEPVPGFPAVSAGLAGTLTLIQALGDAQVSAPLWVLTQGAVGAGPAEAPASPAQAQIWGLGRVAALEHPDRWGGLIDLPPAWDEQVAARMCAVLAGCGEDQVAVRQSGVRSRRLSRAALPATGDGHGRWVPRGTALITGGTGAIGGHLARWLVSAGIQRLVLVSRSGPVAAGVAALAAQVAEAGTSIQIIACDLTQRPHVAGLVERAATGGPPLTAVLHAAGALQVTALERTSVTELGGVLGAKATGAGWLDELTAGMELDAFVLFSSISATWGSGLQPGYAAANAFLDALAARRVGRGQTALSVAWGPWDGGGMSTGEIAVQLQRLGLRLMDPDLALKALAQAMAHDEQLVTVADVDWARFAPAFTVRRPSPLIVGLPEVRQALAAEEAAATTAAAATGTALGHRLSGLPSAEQDRIVLELVRAEAAVVLGHSAPEAVPASRAFRDLGFDSLTAIELRSRLNTATGLHLPATLVFDYPTPDILADFLRGKLTGGHTAAEVPVTVTAVAGEPIAIVGMGCRFPGEANDPERLWQLVAAGADAAGISRSCLTLIPITREPLTPARAGLYQTWRASTRGFSGSARGKRWPWTRSSGCCWRSPGRRWSGPGSTQPHCGAARPGYSPEPMARITPN